MSFAHLINCGEIWNVIPVARNIRWNIQPCSQQSFSAEIVGVNNTCYIVLQINNKVAQKSQDSIPSYKKINKHMEEKRRVQTTIAGCINSISLISYNIEQTTGRNLYGSFKKNNWKLYKARYLKCTYIWLISDNQIKRFWTKWDTI